MNSDQFLKIMADRGLRITEQRRTLSKLFVETDGYLMPKDVYEHMEKKYPGVSFDTVYRNLRLMQEMNLIEQFNFEEGVKFRLHCQEHDHHHHLICMDCEKTIPLVFCPMDYQTDIPSDFEVIKHKFEVYGYCKECKLIEKNN